MTYRVATDMSYKAVAANLIWWWDSSRGGWTPTARHVSLKHLEVTSTGRFGLGLLAAGCHVPLQPGKVAPERDGQPPGPWRSASCPR